MKKLVNIFILVAVFAFSQATFAQDTYKYNPGARATINNQNQGVPGFGAISQKGEVYVQDGDGLVACSAAATGTSVTPILAGAANTSILVSRINCHNNTTVASIITFLNNTTSIGSDLIGTTTLGTNRLTVLFPQPVLIDGAKALNFQMTTTSTSTICCANYQLMPNLTPTATVTPTITPTNTPTRTPTNTPTP